MEEAVDPLETAGALHEGFAPSFLDLYREQFTAMVHLAVVLSGHEAGAEDLVHDVFIRVHAKWMSIDHPHAYLRRAVINACRSLRRRTRRERAVAHVPIHDVVDLEANELFDALGTLPYRQRAALVLRYYEGLSHAEIAAILDCREGTAASLVHRGLEHLRRVVDR
jgi:RNA polymerase sigma factor (sigma-70 family)